MVLKCPHCNETTTYMLENGAKEVSCTICGKTFFVSYEGLAAKDKASINKIVPKDQVHEQLKLAALIAFSPALIVTGLIVIPVLLFLDHLELTGKLKSPDWVVKPAIAAIAGLFFFIWKWSLSIVKRKWFSSG